MTAVDAAERIESLKAGLIGSGAMAIALLLSSLARDLLFSHLDKLELTTSLVRTGSILLTGFLFGITYRYIVRQDANPQLKVGAVMAFGLVRGLAQVEAAIASPHSLITLAFPVLESLAAVAIARLSLDWAIRQSWLKEFGS